MSELSEVTAAILAGGLGTRLRSVVSDRPKVLAEVSGRPFIEYLLDQLVLEGVRRAVLLCGFMGEQVQQRLGSSYHGKIALEYSQEPQPMGTAGALRLALSRLDLSDPVLVLNGDSYCDARLDAFAVWHAARESAATILLTEVTDTRRYGRVQVDDDGRVLRFMEKAQTEGPGWVNGGIYLLRRELIAQIPAGQAMSLERQVFPSWIGKGLHGFRSEGRLWDIGVPEAYARANAEFVASISR
ncbi:nucleotidyltransferase family protein [Fontivita pretiosa]|uniref:nucleotidyltransferase family protein n=1 Tax=Fontivita pretiosa TaxID=2989684 RepID=UPI003D16762E